MVTKIPHVAIVDDEPDTISVLEKAFSIRKIPVSYVAHNGLEAVHRFKNAAIKPDVIIMDHRMPLANGVEATREILLISPDVKIIFLSADNSIEDAAREAGAISFLKKPVSMSAIVAAVRAAV